MERRDTCRTTLALNLHRKNKSDIARKNYVQSETQKRRQVKVTMRKTWQTNASTWKVETIAVRERLRTPKREASPIIRDVALRQPRRHKNPRKGKQTAKGQAKTEESKGWGDTTAAVCQYWPKGKEKETPTEAESLFRETMKVKKGQLWTPEIYQISSIWNISTIFNECRCRPRFMPGHADLNVIFPK